MMNIARYLAQGISFILHPFLMPAYALLFIFTGESVFSYLTPQGVKMYCLLITASFLLLLPLLSLPFLKALKLISSYGLTDKRERVYPILFTMISAFIGVWMLGKVPYTNIVRHLYLALIFLLGFFSVISIRWKMSMHMTAIGAMCGLLVILRVKYYANVYSLFVVMILLAGLLASSRLYLKRHNPLQVYIGFLFGLCLFIIVLY